MLFESNYRYNNLMNDVIRKLFPPLLSLIILMMASAIFSTFVSLRLEAEGFGKHTIGIVAASAYGGILLGSLYADRWIQRFGHLISFAQFITGLAVVVMAQSLWIDSWYWAVLRFAGGMCMAGIFVAVESWLLILSPADLRGRVLSLYLALFYGGLSSGQLLIHVCDTLGSSPFWLSGGLTLASLIPLLFCKAARPKMENTVRLNLIQVIRLSPLGFLGGVISGILLAAIYGLVPLYGKGLGLQAGEIGNLMAMIVFGGLSLQWPLGRIADRSDRKKVLNISALFSAFFGLAIALFGPASKLLLMILGWLFGGFAFTIYPLSMAYTCENVKEDQIVAATGGFVLSYGIGAVFGPLIGPVAMHNFGGEGLFYFLGIVALFIPICSWISSTARTLPLEEVRKESPRPDEKPPEKESSEI